MPFTAASRTGVTGIGPQASPGISHAQARIMEAGTPPTAAGMPYYRRFENTGAGTLQLPAAYPTMAVPLFASPPSTAGGDLTAAHTVRRRHWWEL